MPLDGSLVIASLVATPVDPIVIEVLVAEVRPLEAAVKVYDPAVLNTRFENVATPPVAFTVSVPETPVGVELMVMDAVEVVTRLPLASSTCTTTLPMAVPGLPEVGCEVIASLVAGPALIVIGELVALLKPADDAVSV